MDISLLSDHDLTSTLDSFTLRERENTVELLRHLIEFDSRGLYREMGYSSLFDYCTRRLKFSEGGAFRRVSAARCLKNHPELAELLITGQVTLCTVSAAAKSIEMKTATVTQIVGRSKKDVQCIVAASSPVAAKPREVIRPLLIEIPANLVEAPKREERVRIDFSVSKEAFEELKKVQGEFSIEAGKALSLEEVVVRLVNTRSKKRSRKRVRIQSSKTRYIPKAVKQEVFARNNGQCCFVSAEGIRCSERRFLQFDHIHPFAKGGLTEASNLRLLCPAHNRLMAEREFGKKFIQARIGTATGGVS